MATVRSAGILLYRRSPTLEVWIGHMGGPYWAKKDDGAWSIPKGIFGDDEEPLAAAMREFAEELGVEPPATEYAKLGEFRQSSGKVVVVFAAESDFELDVLHSNTFDLEWPPRSGRTVAFPELDDARWFPIDVARAKVVKGQRPMLDALERGLG
jgi:predicted NUDIX family NTP pyrophosphohydrolase